MINPSPKRSQAGESCLALGWWIVAHSGGVSRKGLSADSCASEGDWDPMLDAQTCAKTMNPSLEKPVAMETWVSSALRADIRGANTR